MVPMISQDIPEFPELQAHVEQGVYPPLVHGGYP